MLNKMVVPMLIAFAVSAVVTVVLSIIGGFLGGACHCMTPMSVLFPYGTFITMRTSWEEAGFYAHIFQYSLYAVLIALAQGWRNRLIVTCVVLIVHALAAVFAVNMYEWWR